ncbi:hypothetical protein, partial [Nioella sp.]|uniref:hypothetical protein n=1 Tax=Nioella sp. TaxID=1912091 RepID=UPI003511269F
MPMLGPGFIDIAQQDMRPCPQTEGRRRLRRLRAQIGKLCDRLFRGTFHQFGLGAKDRAASNGLLAQGAH